jgi:ABC-2 type transport system permease protein
MSDSPSTAPRTTVRDERIWPKAWLVARREFRERVASRLFVVSTLLLAILAMGTSLTPVILRALDRGTSSTIAIAADDEALGARTQSTLAGILDASTSDPSHPPFTFVRVASSDDVEADVAAGRYDAAVVVGRDAGSGIRFRLVTGSAIGDQTIQTLQVGMFAVSIFDWIARGPGGAADPFVQPTIDVFATSGSSAGGGQAIAAAEFASRRVVGIVFVVLIFITLVIYGMWVAAGVVAEKSSRVMELLISAASPAQLVIGKVIGIGLAGLVQYVGIVIPAVVTLLLEDRIAGAVLGTTGSLGLSLDVLSPGLLAAYGGFWILGFVLYSLLYAAAGSLVSRAEDLQVLALPLSLVAIAGYLLAVMSLSGGVSTLMRVASLVPFWSPFMMLTRLTVGRAAPWEIAAAYAFLVAAILVVGVIAIRVYSAGVLLYGQRPGLRAIVGAVVNPPV